MLGYSCNFSRRGWSSSWQNASMTLSGFCIKLSLNRRSTAINTRLLSLLPAIDERRCVFTRRIVEKHLGGLNPNLGGYSSSCPCLEPPLETVNRDRNRSLWRLLATIYSGRQNQITLCPQSLIHKLTKLYDSNFIVCILKQGFIQAPFGGKTSPPQTSQLPPPKKKFFGQLWFPRQLFVLTF